VRLLNNYNLQFTVLQIYSLQFVQKISTLSGINSVSSLNFILKQVQQLLIMSVLEVRNSFTKRLTPSTA